MKRPFQTLAAEWLFICKSTTRSKEKTLFTYDTIHRTCLRGGFVYRLTLTRFNVNFSISIINSKLAARMQIK
jgi:hypothetical protein